MVALFDTPAPGYPRLLGSRRMASRVQALGRLTRGVAPPKLPAAGRVRTAAGLYAPKPIDTAVVQFMAEDEAVSSRVLEDPRLAWRELCRGDFQVCRVPGNHVTWLHEGNARQCAASLTGVVLEFANRAPAAAH